jgi:hypothetical protein
MGTGHIIGDFRLKFKSIFIALNFALLFFMAAIVLAPIFLMGTAEATVFLIGNWLFVAVLILIIITFNVFYFTNNKLFMLLEKENWPALVRYLEQKVIRDGKYSPRLVRLLANSYLVLSDSSSVMSLENKAAIVRPSLVEDSALLFGTARILGKDISGAVRFFEARKDTAKAKLREWIRWYYGFALMIDRQTEKAADEFSLLARFSKDGVICGLSSYFLSSAITKALPEKTHEFEGAWKQGSERVRKALPEQRHWQKEISRLSSEIHIAVLSRYINEASRWLYKI